MNLLHLKSLHSAFLRSNNPQVSTANAWTRTFVTIFYVLSIAPSFFSTRCSNCSRTIFQGAEPSYLYSLFITTRAQQLIKFLFTFTRIPKLAKPRSTDICHYQYQSSSLLVAALLVYISHAQPGVRDQRDIESSQVTSWSEAQCCPI